MLTWLVGISLSYATSAAYRVYPHYLIVSYPVVFGVQGLGLADLAATLRHRSRLASAIVGYGALATIMIGYVAFTLAFHEFLAQHGGTKGDYGVTYEHEEALARFASDRGAGIEEACPAANDASGRTARVQTRTS